MRDASAVATVHEPYETATPVYTRDPLSFKAKTWTWSDPGPMASAQHAERKEIVSSDPEFEAGDFEGRCWFPDSWDWE
jgi:hypothetical protein